MKCPICSDIANKECACTTVVGGDDVTNDGIVSCSDTNAFDDGGVCKACSDLNGNGCNISSCIDRTTGVVGDDGTCVSCAVQRGAFLCGGDEFLNTNIMGRLRCDGHCAARGARQTALCAGSAQMVCHLRRFVCHSSELNKTTNTEGIPTQCGGGFFVDNSTCLQCNETRTTCNDASTCFSSATSDVLSNGASVDAVKVTVVRGAADASSQDGASRSA